MVTSKLLLISLKLREMLISALTQFWSKTTYQATILKSIKHCTMKWLHQRQWNCTGSQGCFWIYPFEGMKVVTLPFDCEFSEPQLSQQEQLIGSYPRGGSFTLHPLLYRELPRLGTNYILARQFLLEDNLFNFFQFFVWLWLHSIGHRTSRWKANP